MVDQFPLTRDEAVTLARQVVVERYPQAICAWLAGSVVSGTATSTSDLDVTVLLPGPPAPMRESVLVQRVPVELFVHTEASLSHYRAKDRARRQPTMARLVAGGVVLLDPQGKAPGIVSDCVDDVMSGPDPLPGHEIDASRYAVSDLVADLRGTGDAQERLVIAATLWERSARLLLGIDRQWQGSGKGLLRALRVRDRAMGDDLGSRLAEAFTVAAQDPDLLAAVVTEVLDRCGGALFDGYRVGGDDPLRPAERD